MPEVAFEDFEFFSPRGVERPRATGGRVARISGSQSVSKPGAAAGFEIGVGLRDEMGELAGLYVEVELLVLGIGVKFEKPVAKRRRLFRRQFFHGMFDFLHGAHGADESWGVRPGKRALISIPRAAHERNPP